MQKKIWISIASLSLAGLLIGGCDAELSGSEDNLTLTFDKGANLLIGPNTPLAVGSRLDYVAHQGSAADPEVKVEAASSSDDTVIEVIEIDGPRMTLEAHNAGSIDLDVDAGSKKDPVHDRFKLSAREVDKVAMDHFCAPGKEAAYLAGHDISLKYTMTNESTVLVGTGYYPVQANPDTGAQIARNATNGVISMRTGRDAETVQLVPTTEGDTLELNIVTPDQIVDLRLPDDLINEEVRVEVGETRPLHIIPLIKDDIPVCQSSLAPQISHRSPEVCEVKWGPLADEDRQFDDEFGILQETYGLHVKGLTEGSCEFVMILPEEVGTNGQQHRVKLTVE